MGQTGRPVDWDICNVDKWAHAGLELLVCGLMDHICACVVGVYVCVCVCVCVVGGGLHLLFTNIHTKHTFSSRKKQMSVLSFVTIMWHHLPTIFALNHNLIFFQYTDILAVIRCTLEKNTKPASRVEHPFKLPVMSRIVPPRPRTPEWLHVCI